MALKFSVCLKAAVSARKELTFPAWEQGNSWFRCRHLCGVRGLDQPWGINSYPPRTSRMVQAVADKLAKDSFHKSQETCLCIQLHFSVFCSWKVARKR